MKKGIILLMIILFLTGCGIKYPELKDDAIAFEMGEYIDEDASYGTIEYKGRTYMAYGTLKGSLKSSDLKDCIGYIVEDKNIQIMVENKEKDARVYTLTEDLGANYLMVHYIVSEIMNQPMFWRAMDTKGKDIKTPAYIEIPEEGYWAYDRKNY